MKTFTTKQVKHLLYIGELLDALACRCSGVKNTKELEIGAITSVDYIFREIKNLLREANNSK